MRGVITLPVALERCPVEVGKGDQRWRGCPPSGGDPTGSCLTCDNKGRIFAHGRMSTPSDLQDLPYRKLGR